VTSIAGRRIAVYLPRGHDAVGLVHMNGRVYDPSIGRFLSADPTVQSPFAAQDLNRYALRPEQPLELTDPSGFGFLVTVGTRLRDSSGHLTPHCQYLHRNLAFGGRCGFWGQLPQARGGGFYLRSAVNCIQRGASASR